MNKEHMKDFYVVMKACSEIYMRDLSDEIINIFWEILKDYDIVKVKNAFSNYLKNPNNDFFPRPAQILEEIEGKLEVRSLQAWSKTLDAIKTNQYYRSLLFDDEIIHQVIKDFGGLEDFCEVISNIKSISFTQKEFRERYEMYAKGYSMNPPSYIVGQSERHEMMQSPEYRRILPPTIVGNSEKAIAVFLKLSTRVPEKPVLAPIFEKLNLNTSEAFL